MLLAADGLAAVLAADGLAAVLVFLADGRAVAPGLGLAPVPQFRLRLGSSEGAQAGVGTTVTAYQP